MGKSRCNRCGEVVDDIDAGFSPAVHGMSCKCGGRWVAMPSDGDLVGADEQLLDDAADDAEFKCEAEPISSDLSRGIAAYRRTWSRFDGLVVSAQCGGTHRRVGTFAAGECQPTITTPDGERYFVRDLGSLRVVE
jgi:hypothetical protein